MEKLITIGAIVLFIAWLILMAWIIARAGVKGLNNARDFEDKYAEIESLLYEDEILVNDTNYAYLNAKIMELTKLPHKEKERTSVLVCNFQKKFGKIYCEKLIK